MSAAAGVPIGHDRDLTAEARIRRAAMRLFGERGYDATTTRAIAAAAGVSAALVIHHFGSKDNLRDQVDRDVVATVDDIFSRFSPADGEIDPVAYIAGYRRLFGEHPEVTAYMRRSLIEQSTGTNGLLTRLLAYVEHLTDDLVRRGLARPPSDPKATAALQAGLGLTAVLLGPLLGEFLGGDEPVEARLARAELELLSAPYFRPTGGSM